MNDRDDLDQATLLAELRRTGDKELAGRLDGIVRTLGERQFCRMAAAQLVRFARPEQAIPKSLDRFVPLVREGIEFFLAEMPYPRLRRVLLSRALFLENAEPGERLLKLALFFPTLHKLGQIIARNPHIDPGVKKWLVGLEHGDYGTDPEAQVEAIRGQLTGLGAPSEIGIEPRIVAEASVATVLPFYSHRPETGRPEKGVFKILKPGVREDLLEELDILAKTFAFLETDRKRYGLREMKLTSIFREIHVDMAREIDLVAEQHHLKEAARMYARVADIRIPKPAAPFCTPTMTAMEYIDGHRIGDIVLTRRQRRSLARRIFEAILCVPLFAEQESALFHGDPHAGNLLVLLGNGQTGFEVALLDWTLAGHLSKRQRELIMALLLGIMKNDSRELAGVVERLEIGKDRQEMRREELAARIEGLLGTAEYLGADPLRRSFLLLENMTLDGVVFPSELILFRKSFFTLEGVLHDIHPGFAMGEAMELYLVRLLMTELPLRCGTAVFPMADRPGNYRSMLSNTSLKELSLFQATGFFQETLGLTSSFLAAQCKLLDDFLLYFSGSCHQCSE